ncbi:MAG TPA: DNA topoisomerase 4 subunit A, partial [Chloroflexi bacterium]|nr:DNA topoisomerase 4 subunit A [Chloroflexota bacterium]
YHPHGDAAVYDAMARMAQDFSLRYPLVDGQGNFGSIDGDSPAAMRYTEARLAPIAVEMLSDIQKDTVDFAPNFDDTLQEPTVLPAAIPNLLVNGASGIAVGMATSIPPHNLGEVCDGLIHLLDNWKRLDDVTVDELMQYIQGPDFPTGGVVYRRRGEEDALAQAYGTGRGRITVRARVHVEEMSRSRHRLVVTELPYQVNKSNLVERIASLVREGRVEGITDVRDESDRRGMRLVIELSRTAEPEAVLADLFRLTPLETTFSLIFLALVDGEPRLLTLKRALLVYLEHRQEIVARRSRYDLERAKERAHILEGLLVALDHLDEVIEIIRRSRSAETAHKNLRRRFKLTAAQATAILDMPLKRLAALEQHKIEEEYKEKKRLIRHLTSLLKSPAKIRGVIREELLAVKEKYADPRRTQVVGAAADAVTGESLVPDLPVWVVVTHKGHVAYQADEGQPPRVPSRVKEPPLAVLGASTRHLLYLFTADGQAAAYPVHQLPKGVAWTGAGTHWADLTPLTRRQEVVAALVLPPSAEGYLFLATEGGTVKRVSLEDLPGVSADPFPVIGVGKGDRLARVVWTRGNEEVVLTTWAGRAIRFREETVRSMGLPAGGVKGIRLGGDGDRVVGLDVVRPRAALLVVSEDGHSKRTPLSEYPTQGRSGQGVVTARFTAPDVGLAGAVAVHAGDPVVLVTEKGAAKTIRARSVPQMGRPTRGKEVIALRKGDRVSDVFRLIPSPTG